MTLVVARKSGSVISVVSDTGVTEHDVRLPPERCIPKMAILTPDLAVAFAGNPQLATRAINAFPRSAAPTYRSIISYFANAQSEAENLELLVLLNKPMPKIVRIRDGTVNQCDVGWIGDKAGYEAFQRYKSRSGARPSVVSSLEVPQLVSIHDSESQEKNHTFQLLGALRYVLLDSNVPSVFGSGVALNNVDGHFQFRSYALVLDEQRWSLTVTPQVTQREQSERAELRNYAFSCFVASSSANSQVVAFHFPEGSLTHLYSGPIGKVLEKAEVIPNMNIQQLQMMAKQRFGVELWGPMALRHPPSAMYGVPLNMWQESKMS